MFRVAINDKKPVKGISVELDQSSLLNLCESILAMYKEVFAGCDMSYMFCVR